MDSIFIYRNFCFEHIHTHKQSSPKVINWICHAENSLSPSQSCAIPKWTLQGKTDPQNCDELLNFWIRNSGILSPNHGLVLHPLILIFFPISFSSWIQWQPAQLAWNPLLKSSLVLSLFIKKTKTTHWQVPKGQLLTDFRTTEQNSTKKNLWQSPSMRNPGKGGDASSGTGVQQELDGLKG